MIKSSDNGMTVLCRSWYQCYLSVFFTLLALLLFFMPYLSLPKCQEQKGRKKRNYRTDYSWGLLIKRVMQKLRIYDGAIWLFQMAVVLQDYNYLNCLIYEGKVKRSVCVAVSLYLYLYICQSVSDLASVNHFWSVSRLTHTPSKHTHTLAFLELLASDKANLSLTQIKRLDTVDRRVAVGDGRLMLLRTVEFTSSKKRRNGALHVIDFALHF